MPWKAQGVVKSTGFVSWRLAWNPSLAPASCMTRGYLPNFSGPYAPHIKNGHPVHLSLLVQGSNEITYMKRSTYKKNCWAGTKYSKVIIVIFYSFCVCGLQGFSFLFFLRVSYVLRLKCIGFSMMLKGNKLWIPCILIWPVLLEWESVGPFTVAPVSLDFSLLASSGFMQLDHRTHFNQINWSPW